ncbi:unnamed protein product [Ambrosiozyma monospora]|uniref:Unnamed protein product n=1 Tax=Ambrosiozyma monospora TaxID=43982 RepID=A0ACB5SXL3_AMBMO|nr:unnamed protein product [Ambrosiozyma monospora]
MSIRHSSSPPATDQLLTFPGSMSPTNSISYTSQTGAPRINIRKSSPPTEDTNNVMSQVYKTPRSRSGSLKMFKQRLQSISSSSPTHSLTSATVLSSFSPRSSMDVHSFSGSFDDLTSEAGPEYIRKNLKSYNELLISYLTQQGLNLNPLRLKQQKLGKSGMRFGHSNSESIQIFITGNGQILYLPHNPSKKKIRTEEGETDELQDQEDDEGDIEDSDDDDDEQGPTNDSNTHRGSHRQKSSKKTHHNVASHTFGIIIKLSKEQTLGCKAKAIYYTDATTKWISGILQETQKGKSKMAFREKYKVSKDVEWELDFGNPDCYIPFKKNQDDDVTSFENFYTGADDIDSLSSRNNNSLEFTCSSAPTQEIKNFELLNVKQYVNEIDQNTGRDCTEDQCLFPTNNADFRDSKTFQPGYYIFLLPVVYPINTPETVYTPLGQLLHHLHIQVERVPYNPSIPAPPSAFLSTSPHHPHSKFDDPTTSMFDNTSVSSPHSSHSVTGASKSLFRKIGRRRSSVKESVSSSASGLLNNLVGRDTNTVYDFRYDLPTIRLPPSDATSTLNKSIYVNKVWNDALNYELLLPKKYIQLSPRFHGEPYLKQHSFMLQMKLIPLIKSLCLKRIRINIVEKITYISKDMRYEEDVGRVDRSGVKERSATLMEIKTKDKSKTTAAPALNTQIVKGCIDDNLLTCCYNNGEMKASADSGTKHGHRNRSDSNGFKKVANKLLDPTKPTGNGATASSSSSSRTEHNDEIAITNPVKLQCPLVFYANDSMGFVRDTHEGLIRGSADINDIQDENNDATSIFSVNTANTYDDTILNSNPMNVSLSNDDTPIDDLAKSPALSPLMSPRRGSTLSVKHSKEKPDESRLSDFSFHPDTSVHNVKIRHRLQICFRISKPDDHMLTPDGLPKMHHYEVIVDTPIVFVSPFCVSDTMDLPSYDYAVRTASIDRPIGSEFQFGRDTEADNNEDLPSFEQAVLMPCSPMLTGFNVPSSLSNVNSTTVLSQSPFSLGSLSPARRDSSVSFTNLDSLIQSDMSNLSLSVGPGGRRISIDDGFSKRELSRTSGTGVGIGGQLSNMFQQQQEQQRVPPSPISVLMGGQDSSSSSSPFTPGYSINNAQENRRPSTPKIITTPPDNMVMTSTNSRSNSRNNSFNVRSRSVSSFSGGPTTSMTSLSHGGQTQIQPQTSQIQAHAPTPIRPTLEHIPSQSSLEFEEELPTYQSVLEQDLINGTEHKGLLGSTTSVNNSGLSGAHSVDVIDSGRDVDDDDDVVSLDTVNDISQLNVTQANHLL